MVDDERPVVFRNSEKHFVPAGRRRRRSRSSSPRIFENRVLHIETSRHRTPSCGAIQPIEMDNREKNHDPGRGVPKGS